MTRVGGDRGDEVKVQVTEILEILNEEIGAVALQPDLSGLRIRVLEDYLVLVYLQMGTNTTPERTGHMGKF